MSDDSARIEVEEGISERKGFLEHVQWLLDQPGMTLDQVRRAIAAGDPNGSPLTLALADQVVGKVRDALVVDDDHEAMEYIHSFSLRIVLAMAKARSTAELPYFQTLARKMAEANSLVDDHFI